MQLLRGAESLRMDILRSTSLGVGLDPGPATLPLPKDVIWREPAASSVATDVAIEPLAMRVPEECFYVRFGQYSNFLWVTGLLEDYGGDIGCVTVYWNAYVKAWTEGTATYYVKPPSYSGTPHTNGDW